MFSPLTLVRTSSTVSNASTAATLVGADEPDEKSLKLSPAPSVSSLKDLATQHELANSIPTAGGLQQLSKSAAATAAQKAASMLAVPKQAVVKESKVNMPEPFEAAEVLEAGQSTLDAGHVRSLAGRIGSAIDASLTASLDPSSGGPVGATVGAIVGGGGTIGISMTIMDHVLTEGSSGGAYAGCILGAVAAAFPVMFGGIIVGGKAENYIFAKIQARNRD